MVASVRMLGYGGSRHPWIMADFKETKKNLGWTEEEGSHGGKMKNSPNPWLQRSQPRSPKPSLRNKLFSCACKTQLGTGSPKLSSEAGWQTSPGIGPELGAHSPGQGGISRVQKELLPAVGADQGHRLLVQAHLPRKQSTVGEPPTHTNPLSLRG